MRLGLLHFATATTLISLLGPMAWADTVIETGGAGHSEPAGAWTDTADGSVAEGMGRVGSRLLEATDGRLSGTASFTATPTSGGRYEIALTWPATANANGVAVILRSPDGESRATLDMAASRANRWESAFEVYLEAGRSYTVEVQAESATAADPLDPLRLAVDGVRFRIVGEGTGPAASTSSSDDPFGDAPISDQSTVENPFVSGEPARVVPTPAPAMPERPAQPADPNDPFGSGPSGAPADVSSGRFGDGPGAAASLPIPDDPFGSSETVAGHADPLDDPFGGEGTAPAATGSNPFEGAEAANLGDLAAQNASDLKLPDDPFGMAGETASGSIDPLSADLAKLDPFAGTETAAETAASLQLPADPFGEAAASSAAALELPSDPFGAAATPAPPAAASTWGAPASGAEAAAILSGEAGATTALNFLDDFEAAKAEAGRLGKPICLFFSGRSTQAESFERVLQEPEVVEALKDFIAVRVDYRRNRAFADKFAVSRYPYLVILNSKGYTLGHLAPIMNARDLAEEIKPYAKPSFLR